MSTLARGTVVVTNGSAIVRGVYAAQLSGVTGTFLANEDISWSTGLGGLGKVVDHDTIAQQLFFYRTSGDAPAAGATIINSGPTKFATLASFLPENTPDFSTELSGGAATKWFTKVTSGLWYQVSSTIGADNFTLTGNYAEATEVGVDYAVVRDASANFGWPLPSTSEPDLGAFLQRLVIFQDSDLFGTAKVTPTLTGNWADVGGGQGARYWKDASRMVHLSGLVQNTVDSAPSDVMTLPAGYRPTSERQFPAIVSGNAQGVIKVSSAGVVTVSTAASLATSVSLDGVHFRAEA